MAILLQGLVLLVAGMGIVYVFLALLVWVVNRAAAIVPRFNHILPDDEPKKRARPAARADDDAVLIAVAIAAARARAA
jgi:oxaloacetate decarboxylase gamma subunit